MNTTNPTRRTAREWAIQMLTAADLNPPNDIAAFEEAYFNQISDLDDTDGGASEARGKLRQFAVERFEGVMNGKDELDGVICPLLDGWDLYRLGTVERAVLRMGVWELRHSDVPPRVAINEAIDLVNWFSSARSRRIVNGVLDKVAKSK